MGRLKLMTAVLLGVAALLMYAGSALGAGLAPGWHVQAVGNKPSAISCPTDRWCAAVGGTDAYVKRGAVWSGFTQIDPAGGLTAVSCASPRFCVAGDRTGHVIVYNGSGWSRPVNVTAGTAVVSASCPATGHCLVSAADGAVAVWSGRSWSHAKLIDNGGGRLRVSCAAVNDCVAVDTAGRALTYNGRRWSRPIQADRRGGGFISLSCPSRTFCMALDRSAHAYRFDGRRWSRSSKQAIGTWIDASYSVISCSSAAFCVAVGAGDEGGTGNGVDVARVLYRDGKWMRAHEMWQASGQAVTVSCAPDGHCVALDGVGEDFAGNRRTWGSVRGPVGNPFALVVAGQCTSGSFCVVLTADGAALSFNGNGWSTPTEIEPSASEMGQSFSGLSCPTAGFCMAIDPDGHVFIDAHGSWHRRHGIPRTLFRRKETVVALSCASSDRCLAAGSSGQDAYLYDGRSWSRTRVPETRGVSLEELSCGSPRFCGALDSAGRFLIFNGRSWSAPRSAGGFGQALACVGPDFCMEAGVETLLHGNDTVNETATFNGSAWSAPSEVGSVVTWSGWPADNNAGLSCSSVSTCLLVSQSDGKLYTYSGGAWSAGQDVNNGQELLHGGLNPVTSCAADGFCMLLGSDNDTPLWSDNPFVMAAGSVRGAATPTGQLRLPTEQER